MIRKQRERVAALAQARGRGEAVRVVATSLPPAAAGPFETVWQVASPLPHVLEAAALTRRHLFLCRLQDVAVPQGWRVVGEVRTAGEDEGAGVLVDGRTWAAAGGFDHQWAPRGPVLEVVRRG